jgi:hypothetical protein
MLDLSTISVLCPCNDLESATILDIARRLNIDAHEIKGEWGLSLKDVLKNINNINDLKEIILTIELPPDSLSEQLLIQTGKKLVPIDHHGKHCNPLSSLEQFADLIGYELKEEERHIAIADRDWLYGLSAAGVSFEDALKIRQQEYKIQNKVDLIEETRKEFEQYCHDFDDLRIVLCPEKYCKTMLEVAQLPTSKEEYQENKIKPVLILYHDDLNNKIITQIEFAGEASEKNWVEELVKNDWLQQDFNFWNGGGHYSCFFGATPKSKYSSTSAVNKLVSQILSCALITGRPLSHYNCTFLLTFDGDWNISGQAQRYIIDPEQIKQLAQEANDQNKDDNKKIKNELAAYLYLLPHLRKVLVDTVDTKQPTEHQVLEHWQLPKEILDQMVLTLHDFLKQNDKKIHKPVYSKVDNISLFHLNTIYVLAIKISPDKVPDKLQWKSDKDDWWKGLIYDNEDFHEYQQQFAQKMQIQTWLRFTKLARILYQSFSEQVFENKITNLTFKHDKEIKKFGRGYAFSPIIEYIISLFFKQDDLDKIKERLKETQTDRMYVNVAYGLAGIAPEMKIAKERHERLFSLALYVDDGNDGKKPIDNYAYDPKFTKDLLKLDVIKRWKDLGTYSGYTIYSNVHFGSGWFFNDIIAPQHVPYIYGHMLVVGLFYQASLRYFAKKVSDATKELASENGDHQKAQKNFRNLRREFIIFTNDYWFRDITDQIQGIEIFEKQTKALRLNEEYALIKDEMERADEYMEALRKEDFDHKESQRQKEDALRKEEFDHKESQRQKEDALRKEENDQKIKLISIIAGVLGFAGLWATTLAVPTDKEWFNLIMLSDLSIMISSLTVIFSVIHYFRNQKN